MRLVAALVGLTLLFGQPALAAVPAVGPATATTDDASDHGDDGHGADDHGPVDASSIFNGLFGHLTPHAVTAVWFGGEKGFGFVSPYQVGPDGEPLEDSHGHKISYKTSGDLTAAMSDTHGGGRGFLIFNINTVQWIVAVLLVLVMVSVARRARSLGDGAPRGSWYGVMESLILFVRDEMVYGVMGKHHGRPLVPLFLTQFFFILFMNIFGLVPDVFGTGLMGTATANLMVTGGLAVTTLLAIHIYGIKEHGFGKHWANFVPHVPGFVYPIMVVVEAIGIVVKPAALTVRLFANLTAGHLVVLGMFGLIQLAGASLSGAAAWGAATPVILMAIAINCLELFVAFVQAYIFTYLSIVFVGASLHPDH